ncbi:hypothetical protein Tco_0633654 [Tanacetum coccineum]
MVAYLKKSEESKGFHQIVDFLNSSHIKYAFTENPPICESFIKQFWQIASASTLEDGEVGITATTDRQLKTVNEASLIRHLKLEDADGISSLPNTKIFEQLALMGYVSNTDKLTFQKGHFSPQWRFLIHVILHCLSPKKTAWEQFSSNIATAIICLATNRTFKFSKMIFDAMVKNLDSPHKFFMYPRFIQIILNKQKRLLQPHTRLYITPTLTQKLFGNMKRASKGYTGVDIPLFPTMLVQGPILQGQLSDKKLRVDVRLEGAATTVSSLDAGQGSGNIDKTPSMPHDSPLPYGHTPRSDEGRMQQNELIDLVTKLSNRVLVLEIDLKETKKVYSTAFIKLIMKVKKLEKLVKSNKARRRAKFIVSDDEEDLEDSSKQGRRIADIDQDSDISLVHHDADIQGRYEDISTAEFNISTNKPVSTAGAAVTTAEPSAPSTTTIKTYTRTTRGVTIREHSTRHRLSPQQQIDPKNKGKSKMVESEKPSKKKDQVKADKELAKRLEEEMQDELEEEARIERIAQEEASIAALTAEFDVVQARMDVVQARIDADALLTAKIQEEEREQFSINEQARFLVETITERKRFFAAQRAEQIRNKPPTIAQLRNKMVTYLKHMEKGVGSRKKTFARKRTGGKDSGESMKKQKLEDDTENEELKAYLDIVLGDEITMEVESLATKYPIADWKTHILFENMMYYQIIRVDGSSKNYKIFNEMLDDFDRKDVMDLHRLVQERIAIHMMIEKKYPLTQEMLSRMLSRRLEVDHESEMAFELLRFTRSHLKE